jgi:hypothetical protein
MSGKAKTFQGGASYDSMQGSPVGAEKRLKTSGMRRRIGLDADHGGEAQEREGGDEALHWGLLTVQ